MNPETSITPSDQLHLQHAQGYLELGMFEDAWKALEELEPEFKAESRVLKLRVEILMGAKKWEHGAEIGRTLCGRFPQDGDVFIQTAFCLHELKRTEEAKRILLSGPETLHENALFHYNLSCYAAQLGDLEGAMNLLKFAIKLDPSYRKLAMEDPDLAPIRETLKSSRET